MTTELKEPFKILVVDDEVDLEPLVLQRMRREIRRGKYLFVFAHNGVEAIEKLKADNDIDMVLSDINMPQMDGLTLLAQLPEIDPDLRAVIISAYGDMRNIRTAMNRGAFDFITKPIDFDDLQVTIERTLEHLANWRAALTARDQLVTLHSELGIAGETQKSILPESFPKTGEFEVHASMVPAREVGGDLYDVIPLSDGRTCLIVADVSGKGMSAALLMMAARTAFKAAVLRSCDPSAALTEANNLLCEDSPAEMFVTAIALVYDPSTGECTYASAGHHAPIRISSSGDATELDLQGGVALGMLADGGYDNHTVTLESGDALVCYTDGVTEAMSVDHEEFGLDRLLEVFSSGAFSDAETGTTRIFNAVHEFAGEADQSDDITCLCLLRRS